MSNLNLDILVQSVDKLSRQYEKNLAETENEKVNLSRATALLEGLKGMFGMDEISVKSVGNNLLISVVAEDSVLDLYMDPTSELKLCEVKAKKNGKEVDVSNVVNQCAGLGQPNDIRQALYLLKERVADVQ